MSRTEEAGRLYYIDGLSYAEIAAQMDVTRETVKTHLRWFRINTGIESHQDANAWFHSHGAYEVVEYPTTPIPAGGYVQSPPGVLVPFAASQSSGRES